jgi:hypothetical protein
MSRAIKLASLDENFYRLLMQEFESVVGVSAIARGFAA